MVWGANYYNSICDFLVKNGHFVLYRYYLFLADRYDDYLTVSGAFERVIPHKSGGITGACTELVTAGR
jgi:hypothetical protein